MASGPVPPYDRIQQHPDGSGFRCTLDGRPFIYSCRCRVCGEWNCFADTGLCPQCDEQIAAQKAVATVRDEVNAKTQVALMPLFEDEADLVGPVADVIGSVGRWTLSDALIACEQIAGESGLVFAEWMVAP